MGRHDYRRLFGARHLEPAEDEERYSTDAFLTMLATYVKNAFRGAKTLHYLISSTVLSWQPG